MTSVACSTRFGTRFSTTNTRRQSSRSASAFLRKRWTPVALTILDELFTVAAVLGVTIFCASGDHGAEVGSDGNARVLAPASSPFAHACGGTQIVAGADPDESGWAQGGGGFSARFGVPAWQSAAGAVASQYGVAAGRGVPDVAAQVTPGYAVFFRFSTCDGRHERGRANVGGTNGAPQSAAREERRFLCAAAHGAAPGTILRDVLSGGNDRYRCAAGWIRAPASACRPATRSKPRFAAGSALVNHALERIVLEGRMRVLILATASARRPVSVPGIAASLVEIVDRTAVRGNCRGGFALCICHARHVSPRPLRVPPLG